jgi:PAS domain S-box-containing protein
VGTFYPSSITSSEELIATSFIGLVKERTTIIVRIYSWLKRKSLIASYAWETEGQDVSNNSKDQDIGKPSPCIRAGAEELRLAGESVRKAEIEYRVIFEAMGNATALIEDDLTITLANGEFEKLSGYSREEIEGRKTLAEFLASHDAREIKDYFSHRGENYNLPPQSYTILFINKQGEPMEAVVTLTMVPQLKKSILTLAAVRKLREAEESLKSSETRFRSLFENSPVGIVISRDGYLIYANPAFLYMFGLNETTKLQGETLVNYVAPIGHQMITEVPELRIQSQNMYGSLEEEAIGQRKDGTIFPVQINAFRINLLDGPANATFISDIAGHKQAEDELKLRAQLLDAANDSIVVHDFTGRFLFVNEAACKLYGYAKAKMMQKNIFELNTPEYKQLWESRTKVLKEKGKLVFEVINTCKGGLNTILEVNARLIEGTGGNALVLSVSRDISERKQTEEALRQSEERFSRAFHSSPCAMSITHLPDFRIIDANQRWLDMTGFSLEDVVGKLREDMNIWTEQQYQQTKESLNEYGSVNNQEAVFRNKKGEERYGLWSGEIITLDGEPCLLGATIDITERKEHEQEMARLERLNLMGEIAGGIAHEIRNPMTVVRGYLQMMQFKEEFASHKKRFDTMMNEIDRANAIITEFLSLAKYAPPNLKKQSINSTF